MTDDRLRPATPSSVLPPPAFARRPGSPVRFAATTGAFGLASSSGSSSQSSIPIPHGQQAVSPSSPQSIGTHNGQARRMRRSSLLSLRTTDTELIPPNQDISPTSLAVEPQPTQPVQPQPRWGGSSLLPAVQRVSSAPPIPLEGLTTSTPPIHGRSEGGSGSQSPMAMDEERPQWRPQHLQRRSSTSGSTNHSAPAMHPRLTGRPLPGALLATLISESAPLEHEMRSEARLQRLLSAHPSAVPLTPRQRRNLRMSRGRFPEMVEDDDDDDRAPRSRWQESDTDSDDMIEDEWTPAPGSGGAVNTAFASIMDLDRPTSSGSSFHRSDSGKSTPSGSTRPSAGGNGNNKPRIAPSPGSGLQLPSAFGGLGMGSATPIGSPTTERAELAASPTVGMMQYRDPARPGKRKAVVEDRFDPYKRPRGSSPSPFQNVALSPSKPTSIPIPSSPSHVPALSSALALGSPGYLAIAARPKSSHHPYTRPMSSRSRAASPALSIGSTGGVLSSSLKEGKPLAGPFIPTGVAVATEQPSLGSLGLLSIGRVEEETGDGERSRSRSGSGRGEAMEED